MEFTDYELIYSKQRMQRYLIAAGNDQACAIELYELNIRIGKSLYPLIGAFEVALRNRICAVLTDHFKDPNWIVNQKQGFMVGTPPQTNRSRPRANQRGHQTDDFLMREVEKAENKIRRRSARLNSAAILAEQTMGFWTELFEERYYRLLRGKPIQAFGKLPPEHGRREICQMLHHIRKLRNRISHNEPIIFNGSDVDLAHTQKLRGTLLELAAWLHPKLHGWMEDQDDIEVLIRPKDVA